MLQFENGTCITLDNRRVERVAVTLLDWGSMQDRLVSDSVFKTLATSSINATDLSSEQVKGLNESQKLLAVLQTQLEELSMVKTLSSQPYFDCHFLGVPQLLCLLDGTTSQDDFYKNLKTIKHSVNGSLDMYQTFFHMKKIRSNTSTSV